MNTFFFVYTILVILISAAAGVLAASAFAMTHRRSRLAEAGFFLAYTTELIGIFGAEWVSRGMPLDQVDYYGIESPIARTIEGAIILLCLWDLFLSIIERRDITILATVVVAFVFICITIVQVAPEGPLRQWGFYSIRQAFLAWALIFALGCYIRTKDEEYRQRMRRYLKEYLILWALVLLIFIEDTLVILVLPEPTSSSDLALYLSRRNIFENLAVVWFAIISIRGSIKEVMLRSDIPPIASDANGSRNDNLREHIDAVLPKFAANNNLSAREREVLALVIEGRDNRTIANELFLSEGTVKTHVHNIMKKTNSSTRDELKKRFWAS